VLVTAGLRGTGGGIYSWLGSRPFQFLGGISYGLYLAHDPVIQLMLPVQRHFGLTSTTGAFCMLPVVYVLSIALAYLIRRFIEVPSIRLSHKLKPPGQISQQEQRS
jgi:peptidoglycan/LPS O-acetylase OafA/YrhL